MFSQVYGLDHGMYCTKDYLLTTLVAYDLYEKWISRRVVELVAINVRNQPQ